LSNTLSSARSTPMSSSGNVQNTLVYADERSFGKSAAVGKLYGKRN
jgi:hypothetical protein